MRWRSVAPALLLVVGCGGPPPVTLEGESQHFRLWFDDALPPPAAADVADILAALEANWSDTETALSMPEGKGKIDYHQMTQGHLEEVCGGTGNDLTFTGGCENGLTLYVPGPSAVPFQHELNHAYMFLRSPRVPAPILVEGIAEALGCGGPAHAVDASVSWQSAVASTSSGPEDIYAAGQKLVHHLVVASGWASFLAYYDQAPDTLDAPTFAANFSAFWSKTLDDFWQQIADTPLQNLSSQEVYGICPCSLPPVPLDGADHPDAYVGRYWMLPDLGGDTAALASDAAFEVFDCDAETTRISNLLPGPLLARLGPGRYYASGNPLRGTRAATLADSCGAAAPYDLGSAGEGRIEVATTRTDVNAVSVYLSLSTSVALHIQSSVPLAVCADCSFDSGTCTAQAAGTAIAVQGAFNLRVDLPAGFTLSPAVDVTFGP
jgi:hypothetical protein